MALTAEQIADLVKTTLRELGRAHWTEIAMDLQEYIALPKLLKKERVQFESGTAIQRNVMVDHSGSAKNVGLYATDSYNVVDVMQNYVVPWTHQTTNWAYERREMKMNRTPAQIVNLVKVRRAAAMLSLAQLMEDNLWGAPTGPSDNLTPFGIPYWIVKNATEGFNGGNPTGFPAGAGGLSSTTYPKWANYTNTFTNWTKDDVVFKMRRAFRKTSFKCPIDIPDYKRGADRYSIYTTLEAVQQLELIGEHQNDNLGRDIAKMDGKVLFNGVPVTWVPKLDSDTTDPIYFVNWSCFNYTFLRGEYLVEDPPEKAPGQHTVWKCDVDLTSNTECSNRRRQAVLYKV